jgi:hypothetical protein
MPFFGPFVLAGIIDWALVREIWVPVVPELPDLKRCMIKLQKPKFAP